MVAHVVDNEEYLALDVEEKLPEEIDERAEFIAPSKIIQLIFPRRLTAEIMPIDSRFAVNFTTGVSPTGAQVVPDW